MEEATLVQRSMMDLERYLLAIPSDARMVNTGQPWWVRGFIIIYLLGGISILCLTLVSFYNLFRILKQGTVSKVEDVRLMITDQPVAPFSWMRTVVINRLDYEESGREILAHEMAHIKARHSVDLLITEFCILFHWFNPAAWLLQQELRNIHEYEADENVLNQGVDAKRYQLLLIKKAVGSQRFNSMANSFNHNSLKKRIAMMLKQKSTPRARLKYLCVLPLAAVTIAAFARPEISKKLEKISSLKFSEIISIPEISSADTVGITPVYKPKEDLIDASEISEQVSLAIEKLSPIIEKTVQAGLEVTSKQIASKSNVSNDSFDGIVYIDGLESTMTKMSEINPDQIESISVWKNEDAIKMFGEKGRNGVIDIKKKK